MDSFSWSDSLRATLGPCLQCFGHQVTQEGREQDNPANVEIARSSRTRHDELEGLLGDVEHGDEEAETMSLHSNVGDSNGRKKRKKRRQRRSIRLFGYDLFGRPPIQLSDSEDEEDRLLRSRRRGNGGLSATTSSSSISAFDSDASPLDADAIARMATEEAFEQARQREEDEAVERAKREERRRKRREKRESRHLSISDALSLGTEGPEFEGFQGSGYGSPSLLTRPHDVGSDLASTTSSSAPNSSSLARVRDASPRNTGQDSQEEFGGFVEGLHSADFEDDRHETEADFGGAAYARAKRSRGGKGSDSSRSHTRSQSLSQTSGSQSLDTDRAAYSYYSQYLSAQNSPGAPPLSPQPPPYSPGVVQHPHFTATLAHPKPAVAQPLDQVLGQLQQKKKKKTSRTTTLTSTASKKSNSSPTSLSTSLPSLDSQVDGNIVDPAIVPSSAVVTPATFATSESFEGFPNDSGANAFSDTRFPSVGFGVSRGKGANRASSAANGAFLARRGND